MKTTQEIYAALRDGIYQRSGFLPDDSCDLAVRLYATAAQLESLYAYADWSRRQCFPQTAVGDYLDLHAGMHGVTREAARAAQGSLTIGIPQALSFALTVAEGTHFCTSQGTSFHLTEACTIPIGSTSAAATAICDTAGIQGNVASGESFTPVDAPSYVSAATNSLSFTGGAEAESDAHLRLRVLAACKRQPNGANTAYYEAVALAQPGITSACAIAAYPDAGSVSLCVSGNYGAPTAAQIAAVEDALADRTELGVDLSVYAPQIQAVNVAVTVWPVDGVSGADAVAAARAAIQGFFAKPLIRQGFYRSQAGSLIYNTGLVKNYAFTQPTQDSSPNPLILHTLGTLLVTEGT